MRDRKTLSGNGKEQVICMDCQTKEEVIIMHVHSWGPINNYCTNYGKLNLLRGWE